MVAGDSYCGNCIYTKYDSEQGAFICTSEMSVNYGCETDYEDSCEDFEEK